LDFELLAEDSSVNSLPPPSDTPTHNKTSVNNPMQAKTPIMNITIPNDRQFSDEEEDILLEWVHKDSPYGRYY
jgi:hypothetical protein